MGDEPFFIGMESPYALFAATNLVLVRFPAAAYFEIVKQFRADDLAVMLNDCSAKCRLIQ